MIPIPSGWRGGNQGEGCTTHPLLKCMEVTVELLTPVHQCSHRRKLSHTPPLLNYAKDKHDGSLYHMAQAWHPRHIGVLKAALLNVAALVSDHIHR